MIGATQRPGEVLALRLCVQDSFQGQDPARVGKIYALAPEASQCVTVEEVNTFVDKINVILQNTFHPTSIMPTGLQSVFPCACCCGGGFFGNFQNLIASRERRQRQLQALLEETNPAVARKGYHW
jgi:hypothetical protein